VRVLNVTVSLNPKGGGWPERTIQMSRALAEAGVECSILTFDEGFPCHVEGVTVAALPTSVKGVKLVWILPFASLRMIRALIESVDVVHLMGFRSFLNVIVYRYAHSLKKPVIMCPAGSLPSYGGRGNVFLKHIFDALFGHAMVKGLEACIAVTDMEKTALVKHGFSKSSTHVLPNAIFKQHFLSQDDKGFRAKYRIGGAKFVLFLGRLANIKGPDLLLQAFIRSAEPLHEYHLIFAGPDAGMRHELETTVKKAGIENRVHFVGHIDQPDKSHAYHAAELIVIPSRQEAMSIVALEGGICGTPVLLTDACGFDSIAQVDIRLVARPSIESISERMQQLLCADTDLKSLGNELTQFIVNKYSWDVVVQHYLTIYKELLEVGNGSSDCR